MGSVVVVIGMAVVTEVVGVVIVAEVVVTVTTVVQRNHADGHATRNFSTTSSCWGYRTELRRRSCRNISPLRVEKSRSVR